MEGAITFNGEEISNIPVINRPSYFLVNNYGRESYVTILEPVDDFKRTTERAVLAAPYKSVKQLINAFKENVPVGSTESGFSRKDTVEVFFMGFRWKWRPNHKSFYGAIPEGYELQPLIARWVVLTGAAGGIDNHNPEYLPIRYSGGTGRGFEDLRVNDVQSANDKTATSDSVEIGSILRPIVHSLLGSFMRAAQLNIIPKEAYTIYDTIIQSEWPKSLKQLSVSDGCKYALSCTDESDQTRFVGAVYGGAKLPDWAEQVIRKDEGGVIVTLVMIKASSAGQAEDFMKTLAGDDVA